jgi:TolB protein
MGFGGKQAKCAGIVSVALLLSFSPSAGATFPGQNGKIVFGGYVQGGISVIEPDGTGVTQIVSDGLHPAWSADGRRLAFFRHSVGLHVADADGSGETLIRATSSSGTSTTQTFNQFAEPGWSPDGSTIAYEETEVICGLHAPCLYDPQGIRAIAPDGRSDRQLLPVGASDPVYSPDGMRIAWSEPLAYTLSEIHVSNSDGTGDTVLTQTDPVTGNGQAWDPSWSPDGTRIVFARQTPPNRDAEIWVMNADGTNQTRLTFEAPQDTDPAWSPDGTKIVWTRYNQRLWVMNADGSGQAQLTPDGVPGNNPDWQPHPGPRRSDYRNPSHDGKALRAFMGDAAFKAEYRNHGGCVSGAQRR